MSNGSVCARSLAYNSEFQTTAALPQAGSSSVEFVASLRREVVLRSYSEFELEKSGAYSPASSSSMSVRGVLKFAFGMRERVLRQSRSVASFSFVSRSSPAPTGKPVSELRPQTYVQSPRVIVSPALQSSRLAARASKVARIAERLEGIAEGHRRQHL